MTTKETLDYIVDTFSGADGGIRFYRFRMMLEALDAKREAGDPAAYEILATVERFRRLIEIAQKVT